MSSLGVIELPAGIAIGTGVGAAVGDVVVPKLQSFLNERWSANPNKPPPAAMLAQGVAQGQVPESQAKAWARETGYGEAQMDAMISVANVGPGAAPAFDLWRRGYIGEGQFRGALKRNGIEDSWIDELTKLKDVLLSPAEAANARQQGFMSPAEATAEAERHGLTAGRAEVQYELAGLPPGVDVAQRAANRGLVDRALFDQIVREGHTKTKYTDLLWNMRPMVLSPAEYASARLRTWVTKDEAEKGGALSGATPEQMQLLFLNRGRPASPTQMWTAWARNVNGPRGVPTDYEDHAKAIAISDIRPEYAELLWGIRFNYPSLFQLRGAVQAKALTAARARQILRYQRYEDQDADALIASWVGAGTAGMRDQTQSMLAAEFEGGYISEASYRDQLFKLGYSQDEIAVMVHLGDARLVKGQRDTAVTYFRTLYVRHRIERAEAASGLVAAGVDAAAIDRIMPIWDYERSITRLELTNAQIKRAYVKQLISRQEALTELIDRGLGSDAAILLLDE